jgi:hypothetical protein
MKSDIANIFLAATHTSCKPISIRSKYLHLKILSSRIGNLIQAEQCVKEPKNSQIFCYPTKILLSLLAVPFIEILIILARITKISC